MNKESLISEISQLKAKYHCEKLDVEIREHFEIENGAVSLCGIAAIVDVGNDLFFCDDKYGSYCDFIADLREKVALRKRHIYNRGWYEKIARDVIDWGSRTCFEYKENGLNIMIEYSRCPWGSGWESYVTNEDFDHVEDNFDSDHFERVLEMMRTEQKSADEARLHTEEMLRLTA